MKRREFLKNTAITSGAVLFTKELLADSCEDVLYEVPGEPLPKRPLGKTGQSLSIIGFGGIVVRNATIDNAAQIVKESFERGINYFDVAPTYGDAEVKLGPALKPYRDKVFLACKTQKRDKAGAKEELEQSLENLQTDYFDLYQLHAIKDVEKDVKAALSNDGAIQTFLEAKNAGKIRYLGFSAHSPEAAIYAMDNFDFDTILYPINFCCHYQNQFDQEVIAKAREKNMGILALKALAKQKWQKGMDRSAYPKCWYEPITEPQMAKLSLSWTLSQGTTAAIPPGDQRLFKLALNLAGGLKYITEQQNRQLKSKSTDLKALFPV